MLQELYRTGPGGVVYTVGAAAGLALYNASEDNFWACVGVLLVASVAGGALSRSGAVLWLPFVLLIPIGLAFWWPEEGYEPSPVWGVAMFLLLPSLVAVAGGRWLRARLLRQRARQDSNL